MWFGVITPKIMVNYCAYVMDVKYSVILLLQLLLTIVKRYGCHKVLE
jgi:hypothetical protein